jgi:phage tail sheath protein FI
VATQRKTPGVYISEPGNFPPSIVAVETAVPAFIGYTEKALDGGTNLLFRPMRIGSLADYATRFGGGHSPRYSLAEAAAPLPPGERMIGTFVPDEATSQWRLSGRADGRFNLYRSLLLFYENGGGDCYIVSCGTYGGASGKTSVAAADLLQGLEAIEHEAGPTMLVVPEAVLLPAGTDHAEVAVAMLRQCLKKQDRMAILDVWGTDGLGRDSDFAPTIAAFRQGLAALPPEALRYGAAYFPFLQTSIVQPDEISADDFVLSPGPPAVAAGTSGLEEARWLAARDQSLLPASGAMAGIYSKSDSIVGVWNAPANMGIAAEPTVAIGNDQQRDLTIPASGMAVNAIRVFPGQGTLVWGARTLDGNSEDWRYIQVSRTMIFIEQSVKNALDDFVFAPHTAQTWVAVTSMVESFLQGLWAAGGLMGSKPEEAFKVRCGLGDTMTAEDVADGNMIVRVVLTMAHPAEFIELVFNQQMLAGS